MHTSFSGSSTKSNSWGSLEVDVVDLGKLSETEAAAFNFATAAENLSRAESPRVKKPRGRRCCCLNATTSLVLCVLALSAEGSLFAEVVAGVSEAAAADLRLTVVLLGGRTPVLLEDIVHLCAMLL